MSQPVESPSALSRSTLSPRPKGSGPKGLKVERVEFDIPLLPPSLNLYRNAHWRGQRKVQKVWREYAFVEWLRLGKPGFDAVHVTLHFLFPDRRTRDMDNYIATGSKLVGDAIKRYFIPDDSPKHLEGWSFVFGVDHQNPRTIIQLKEVSNGKDQGDHLGGGAFEDTGRVQGYPG